MNVADDWAVDQKVFFILWAAWAPFGVPLGSLESALGLAWGALKLFWNPLGLPWDDLGLHWGAPWVPMRCLGVPWGLFWAPMGVLEASGTPLKANVAQVPRLHTKSSHGEFARLARGSHGSRWSRWSRRNGVMKCC
jgi:hypothetical protein